MNRRGFMQSILATGVAPWVVTTAGMLMPIRQIIAPRNGIFFSPQGVVAYYHDAITFAIDDDGFFQTRFCYLMQASISHATNA